ncbi:MAG: deoxyribonuclease IV [Planctomycetales bacterium]|nr:deoxyribonuclease IV [Planctomycetales bacterium]
MPILGAHMSIAGGYHKAPAAAREHDCDCVQLFTKNNTQWKAKPISADDVEQFRAACQQHQMQATLSHASYLINIGSPDSVLWDKSVAALIVELERATQLGIPYVVLHPGSYTTASETVGIQNIVRGIHAAYCDTDPHGAQILLETTAGQGSNLGWQFEQLAAILQEMQEPKRIGLCVDTCHLHAAGYPIHHAEGYAETYDQFDNILGLDRIRAFHLNDSKTPLASRKDRHEHIGQGEIGLEGFRLLVNDERFQSVPMYLETPKGKREEDGQDWDAVNIAVLRSLVAKPRSS